MLVIEPAPIRSRGIKTLFVDTPSKTNVILHALDGMFKKSIEPPDAVEITFEAVMPPAGITFSSIILLPPL